MQTCVEQQHIMTGKIHDAIHVWKIWNECFDSRMSCSPSNPILQSVPCLGTLSVWLLSYVLSGGGWHRWAPGWYDCSGKRSSLLLQGSAKTVSCIRFPLLALFDQPWHVHTHRYAIYVWICLVKSSKCLHKWVITRMLKQGCEVPCEVCCFFFLYLKTTKIKLYMSICDFSFFNQNYAYV